MPRTRLGARQDVNGKHSSSPCRLRLGPSSAGAGCGRIPRTNVLSQFVAVKRLGPVLEAASDSYLSARSNRRGRKAMGNRCGEIPSAPSDSCLP